MKNNGTSIRSILDGQRFSGIYYLQSSMGSISRMGKDYWKLGLSDHSGKIDVYFWGTPLEPPKTDAVLWISGQGRILGRQVICDVISILELSSWDGCPLLLAPSDIPLPDESALVSSLLDDIGNAELRRLVFQVISDRQFMIATLHAPGSLNHHHAYPGGLIRHTRETMEIVLAQSGNLQPIERDLLLVAAFLHDLGKAYEYNQYRRLTDRGTLLGHEVTLLEMLAPIMNSIWEINHPTRIALLHFLVAKPAPQWTGIRHPRSALVNILRFADKLSGEKDLEQRSYSGGQIGRILRSKVHKQTTEIALSC